MKEHEEDENIGLPLPEARATLRRARAAGGRPSKLTPLLSRKLVHAIREGLSIDSASRLNFVSRNTVFGWLKRGNDALELKARIDGGAPHTDEDLEFLRQELTFIEFTLAMRAAEAELEHELVVTVKRAAKNKHEAALALLERRHPERWARRPSVDGQPATKRPTGTKGLPAKTMGSLRVQLGLTNPILDSEHQLDASRQAQPRREP